MGLTVQDVNLRPGGNGVRGDAGVVPGVVVRDRVNLEPAGQLRRPELHPRGDSPVAASSPRVHGGVEQPLQVRIQREQREQGFKHF